MSEESKEPRTVRCYVPKPLGLAILIAVAGFARRGDIYKSGADRYAADIFAASTQLIELAEQTIARSYTLPTLLQRADDALKDRELPICAAPRDRCRICREVGRSGVRICIRTSYG